MTEGGAAFSLEAHQFPDKLHTVGRPAPGHIAKVIDEEGKELPQGEVGEIVGRSPAMMTGYNNRPDATRAMHWHDADGNLFYRHGDIGRFDEDGFLTLMDRAKDMRSEEHTSELQSLMRISYAVFCLKKKTNHHS